MSSQTIRAASPFWTCRPASRGALCGCRRACRHRSPPGNPDGSEIAFGRNDDRVSVVSLGAPGAVSTLLPRPAVEAHWSPDGTQIAFDENGQIVIVPWNGPERFVVDEGEAHWPSWSPNGKLLAYNHYSSSGRESVWLYDVKTGERRLFMDLAEQHGWADDDTLLVQAWG